VQLTLNLRRSVREKPEIAENGARHWALENHVTEHRIFSEQLQGVGPRLSRVSHNLHVKDEIRTPVA